MIDRTETYLGSGSQNEISITSDETGGDGQTTIIDVQDGEGHNQRLVIRGAWEIEELADALLQYVTSKCMDDFFPPTQHLTCFHKSTTIRHSPLQPKTKP